MKKYLLRSLAIICLVSISINSLADATSDTILVWGDEMRSAEAKTPTGHPAKYNSQIGILYISMFEAVNASTGSQFDSLSGEVLPRNARAELAASYAAHAALSEAYGSSAGALDARLADMTADASNEEIAVAKTVGTAAFNAVRSSHREVRKTFFLDSPVQFLPPPPPAIESEKYAEDFVQVKDLGGVDSTKRSNEQSEIAMFWSDNRTGTMVTLHWNAETVIHTQGIDGVEFARSMALFAGGLHDAVLSVSASKGAYKTARPIVAIRNAEADGNPRTQADPSWTMFGNNTPPEDLSHSYASGGGTLGSYFANMVGKLIGTDEVMFTYRYIDKPGGRRFERLSDMQTEFGWSRIYNGEHFWHDVEAGWRMSEKIADYIYSGALGPKDM